MKILYVVILVGISVTALFGCGEWFNDPPVIEEVAASKIEVEPGEEITINVVANDPDGDELTYEYDASGGEITGSGQTIVWKAPEEGIYFINVAVVDKHDNVSRSSVEITVLFPEILVPIMVNLQVTEYKNPEALQRVVNELGIRGIDKATIFIGKDIAENNCSLVKELDEKGYEIAVFGYSIDEQGEFVQLATLTHDEQERIIKDLKGSLEDCLDHRVEGFRAQRFSQNEDTNQIVSDLGFMWHASFVSGGSSLPGHENALVPYFSSEYEFFAVSMIGVEIQPGRTSALCDTALRNVVENANQWKETVRANLIKRARGQLPFLTEFHPYFLVDDPDWWNSFIELVDWLKEQNVIFVTTMELAEAYCIPCQENGM